MNALLPKLPPTLSLASVCLAYGLKIDSTRGHLYFCPFHAEKKGSLKLNNPNSRDGWFHCYGCKARGDMIRFVARKLGISDIAAYRRLRAENGLGPDADFGQAHILGRVFVGGLRPFTDFELEQLCATRSFCFEALQRLCSAEILKYVPRYSAKAAYVLCDPFRRVAILRRIDGEPWSESGEKAKFARGSNSKIPIGIHAIGASASVMVSEGGPDYLRAVSLLHECDSDILPVMMSGASSDFDPTILCSFAHKRVRICAHNDEPGIAAARVWQNQLQTVQVVTDIWVPPKIQLPDGTFTKDLDDLFWKLDPNLRAEVREVHQLIDLNLRLFPAYESFKATLPHSKSTA